jgi:hypothetical protein
MPHLPLDERSRALLDFEREWPVTGRGAKRDAVREHFGITAARYYQLLDRLAASEAAFAYDPLTALRLRRRVEQRGRRRVAEALGERRGT